ncbi:4-carboxymuconolactone decarboxylase [Diaphorobacter sp. HDW4A]|uniref:carboxymuconolactone decarboxylase family protein n=1 Tax=Diaphorobacter sp. HDW4A TaxID=2714924 RepID=UPI001409534C|nr:carboxymuconolactone decarboxylase family protein [Diaphorobacter sp. HDW4A]QIL83782.1 4-carboxymuconolactone decarboxylase [Diaphorobacter sp. HDW4A]
MNPESITAGAKTRAQVLGQNHVNQSLTKADEFSKPMEELASAYCWDEIWNRPGLDRRMRSALNLAMLSALNRPQQLKLHIKGALNNGLSQSEIQEILLQAAVYCGIPAGMDAFRVAREVFSEGGV